MKQIYTLRRMLSAAVLLMMSTFTWAYAFEVDGIYYNINEDGESVEVTYKIKFAESYSADIVIPSYVTYNNKTYSVTTIDEYAFYHCNITSVTIPNSVTTIGDDAFGSCNNLTSVTIPNSVTTIGKYAFNSCRNITSLTISNNLTTIAYSAFCGCDNLTSVTIPNNITTIEAYALASCKNLTSVTIPSSVTIIEGEAFSKSSKLASITCLATTPPTCNTTSFREVSKVSCIIHVPQGCAETYKQAAGWQSFYNIVEDAEEIAASIETISPDTEAEASTFYTIDGVRVDTPTHKGIYIKNGKKILIK